MRKFNTSTNIYSESGDIIREQRCFAFMFTNIGDTTARVNGMVIYPNSSATALGDSRTVSGHQDDEFKGIIRLAIDNPANANPLIEIVQSFYVD